MKFLVILLGAAGGILLLVFVLSLAFSAQIALQPTGFAVAAAGVCAILLSWGLQSRLMSKNLSK
ncbi:MAG: hypothetical protein WBA28_07710 [Microbacteriaceae bacterium]